MNSSKKNEPFLNDRNDPRQKIDAQTLMPECFKKKMVVLRSTLINQGSRVEIRKRREDMSFIYQRGLSASILARSQLKSTRGDLGPNLLISLLNCPQNERLRMNDSDARSDAFCFYIERDRIYGSQGFDGPQGMTTKIGSERSTPRNSNAKTENLVRILTFNG